MQKFDVLHVNQPLLLKPERIDKRFPRGDINLAVGHGDAAQVSPVVDLVLTRKELGASFRVECVKDGMSRVLAAFFGS
jgi:hypothetical protein